VNASQFFKQKVASVMTAEGKAPLISLASALYTISLFYGAGQKLREFAYRQRVIPSHQLPCKVICIGNISVGGTGKTPMTMHVAQEINQLGYKAAIVSRGYRGSAESHGGIVSDGKSICMGPEQAGDEPYMMARSLREIPVIIGKNRYAAGMLAVKKFRPDVVVLDDGFQHLRLKRDIDLVLLDHALPFGNAHLLPRGILREPISSLARGTACILTRHPAGTAEPAASSIDLIKKYTPQSRVFTSSHEPYCYGVKSRENISLNRDIDQPCLQEVDGLEKVTIFGFSGIARNADFQNTVKNLGFNTTGFLEFSDHHRYSAHDLSYIQSKAERAGARCLITTEKDLVRLSPQNPFPLELIVVGVKISFGNNQQKFTSFLKKQLSH
jgi:tetraacyldisaccharide 4'-kinase